MQTYKKKVLKWAAVPALALGILAGGAAIAQAAAGYSNEMTLQTIAPGASGTAGITLTNPDGVTHTDTLTFTMQAPSNSTFTDNQIGQRVTTGTQAANGQTQPTNWSAAGCVLSNGNKTMTCTNVSTTVGAAGSGQVGYLDLMVHLTANPGAPYSSTFNDGSIGWTNTNGQIVGSAPQAIGFKTPVDPGAPMVDPLVAGGAVVVAALLAGGVFLVRRRAVATRS